METVGAGFSMSLDGFIAGPNDDSQEVFAGMFQGSTDVTVTIGEDNLELKMSSESAEQHQDDMR